MNPSNFIIHYDFISISENLRQITSTTFKTLKKNKVHIALGGDNLHQLQSAGIPETFGKNYYVHPESYKKFIVAVSLKKRKRKKKSINVINVAKSKCQKVSLNAQNERGKFGANCGICKKRQTKVGPKYQYPKPIGLTDADKNLKEAARLRKDETLLLEIHEVDLIDKEIKNHAKCYLIILEYFIQSKSNPLLMRKEILKPYVM